MERFLTTAEVAERLRQAEATLRWWRHIGFGPESFRAGRRRVLYAESDVDAWIEAQRRSGETASAS